MLTAGGVAARLSASPFWKTDLGRTAETPIQRRPYKGSDSLSIIGFGGILCLGKSGREASDLVGEVVDRGVNYFDVAPSYGAGEAEQKLGPALEPYRSKSFLACKTMSRDAQGSRSELELSLRRMRTDHFDLYQFHAVSTMNDVEEIFAPQGALETFVQAREKGEIRYIGFSAHSEEAGLAMLDRFSFDSILFPANVVCERNGKFGPRVMEKAKQQGVTRLALKAMAYSPWPSRGDHPFPKCWYRPIDDPPLARLALRFTLGEDVTSAIPPGEEKLFRIALDEASRYAPLTDDERNTLIERTIGVAPLFTT